MDPLAAVLALAVVVLAAWERRNLLSVIAIERDRWQEERRELLTRIQRPELVPVTRTTTTVAPEEEGRSQDNAAYRQVGVVQAISDSAA